MTPHPENHAKNPGAISRRSARGVLAALIGVHAMLLAASAVFNSVTFDEYAHLPAGVAYWKQGWRAFAIHNLSPPFLRLWAAGPVVAFGSVDAPDVAPFLTQRPRERHWNYGRAFERANRSRYHGLFVIGRLAMIPISCLGLWVVWKFAGEVYRSVGASAAAGVMYAFNPDLIAHGSIVGTDLGTAVATCAACWLWWRFVRSAKPHAAALGAAAVAAGVAHLCKFTALLVLPALLAMGICFIVRDRARWRRVVAGVAAAALVTWLMINLAYGFSGSFRRLDSYRFTAASTVALQKWLPGATPVPLPANYVDGFDVQKAETEIGVLAFLNGKTYRGSRPDYYPIVLAMKLPVAMLILLVIAIVSIFIRSRWWPRPTMDELPVVAALVVFLVGMIALAKVNIGVRYILPAYPLAMVLASRVFASGSWRPRERWPAARGGLLAMLAIEALAACPRYISFINFGFGGQSGSGWRIINDSNFDWGQGLLDLKRWLDAQNSGHGSPPIVLAYFGRVDPAVYGIDYSPITSPAPDARLVAVSSYYLDGLEHRLPTPRGPTDYIGLPYAAGLRGKQPVGRAGPTIFIYRAEDVAAAAREARQADSSNGPSNLRGSDGR